MKNESCLMRFFKRMRLNSIAWSLRRLYVPVDKKAFVLEIGSGANPFYRSNILCDAYLDTRERHFERLVYDRPTVLAFGEKLPFKDNIFDFVICCHVIEHSKDPEKFLNEIQRVAKAGYIEVPDAFFERLTCYNDHRLEITEIDGVLLIRKKRSYIQDEEIKKLFDNKVSKVFGKFVAKYPFEFHVRYFWSKADGGIKYKILNSDYEIDWEPPESKRYEPTKNIIKKFKSLILKVLRYIFSQHSRNKKINIEKLLICPECKSDTLEKREKHYICKLCQTNYPIVKHNIIKFN